MPINETSAVRDAEELAGLVNLPSLSADDVSKDIINIDRNESAVVNKSMPRNTAQPSNVQQTQTTLPSIEQPAIQRDKVQSRQAATISSNTNAPSVSASEISPSVATDRSNAVASGYEQPTQTQEQKQSIGDMIYPMSYGAPIHTRESIATEKQRYIEEQKKVQADKNASTPEQLQEEDQDTTETESTTNAPINIDPELPTMAATAPSPRYEKAAKETKKETRAKVSQKRFKGLGVYGRILGDKRLRIDQVGIGVEVVEALLRVPNSKFPAWVTTNTGREIDINSPTVIADIIDAVNNSNAKVATWKPPVNRGPSAQKRVLRIVEGRGIFLHPLMAKQYNADFDGDEMTVSFKESALRTCKDSMAYLFDVDGYPSIESSFFPKPLDQGIVTDLNDLTTVLNDAFDKSIYTLRTKNELTKAVIDYYTGAENGFNDLLKTIQESSRQFGKDEYSSMATMLTTTYSILRQISLVQAFDSEMERIEYAEWMALAENSADAAILEITDGLVYGVAPNNFQDLKTMLCEYYGEVDGKNIAFRCSANIAKMFKFDSRTIIGEEGLDMAIERMVSFAMSKRISNSMYKAEKAKSSAELLRDLVLDEVGLPQPNESFNSFMKRFASSYQSNSALIRMAKHQFLSDMSMTEDSDNKIKNLNSGSVKDLIAPFLDIYGDLKVSSVFGQYIKFIETDPSGKNKELFTMQGIQCTLAKYENETIRRMSKMNKSTISGTEEENYKSQDLSSNILLVSMLGGIMSTRTSTASKFNLDIYGNTKEGKRPSQDKDKSMCNKMYQALNELKDIDVTDDRYMKNIIDLLNSSSPDAFAFYEMDNVAGFLESRYGKALLAAKSADEVGGIRMAMIAEMRMTRVINEQDKLAELEKNNAPRYQIMQAENAVQAERAELASCSFLWHSFMMDEYTANSAFKDLAKMENRTRLSNSFLYAGVYWANPQHSSMKEVLLDINLGSAEKQTILADIVRWYEQYDRIMSYEMGYQLELDSGPMWSSLPPNSESLFDVVKDFDGRYKKYQRESREELQRQVAEARKVWGNKPEALMNTLKALTRPGALVDVSDDIYADAITSVLDRVYKQSEKTGEHPAINVLYQGLMYQRYGEFDHDVYRTDDKVLGVMASNKISIHEIVRILADGNESITIYDEFGMPIPINRDILCGVENATEYDIWNLLEREPSIAMAIRGHNVSARPDSKGSAYLSARFGIEPTIKYYQKRTEPDYRKEAKAILRDHPGFAAIIALSVPTKNRVSRNIRNDYKTAENNIINIIGEIATQKIALKKEQEKGNKLDENIDIARYLANRGLTEEALILAISKDTNLQENDSAVIDAKMCYSLIFDMLDRYSNELMSMEKIPSGEINNIYFDEQSIAAFFDIRQELNGAKIAMSTSIEGTETFHFALWMSLLSPEDKFTIGEMIDEEDLEQFNGCQTNIGIPIGEMPLNEMIDKANGELVVEVPPGYEVQDKSTDTYGRQVSSVLTYLIIKRDNGAEQFNMKVKKYGDDGTDSITKHSRFESQANFFELQEQIRNLDPFSAKDLIAGKLQEANENLGYDDMDRANYTSIADLMIVETEDGLKLRSLEMIARAIKNRMPRELIETANIEDLQSMAKEIAATVGTEMSTFDPVKMVANVSIAPTVRSENLSLKPRASAFDRRIELLKIMRKLCRPKGDSTLNLYTEILKKKFPLAKATTEAIAPKLHFIGMIGYEGMQYENIGDSNLWLLDNSDDGNHIFDRNVIESQFDRAYQLGITVGIRDNLISLVPIKYRKDLIPFPGSSDMWMLPTFDMQLNGSESFPPGNKFGIFVADRKSVVASYEDSINEFSLGDAQIQLFKSLVDRIKIKWSDSTEIKGYELFPNVVASFPNAKLTFGFADRATVKRLIVDKSERFIVDYGVTESSKDFKDQKARIDSAIERFANNFNQANELGWIMDGQPGDIAGFAVCKIVENGNIQYCLAPLIPFGDTESSVAPTRYHIDGLFMNSGPRGDSPNYVFNWKWSDSLAGHFFKIHEGAGASNKGMASVSQSVDGFMLQNGIPIDMCYAAESTASRRAGTNRRIRSMESLMFAARCDNTGYNFAEDCDKAFPEAANADKGLEGVREELIGRVSIQRWGELLDNEIVFHSDPQLNKWINNQVRIFYNNGGNPSDFLANRFDGSFTNVFWDFPVLFSAERSYEDNLLKFMNSMRPDLAPDGLEGDDSNTMFKVNKSRRNAYDYGCLQVLIPHRNPDNPDEIKATRETLFIGWSFMGEEFSGFHKPNVNGSSSQLDMLNTMALMGKTPNKENLIAMLQDATRDIAPVRTNAIISIDENMPTITNEDEE